MGQLSGIKISAPTYNDVIPSTKQKVKLTPFRVGDEKTLLIASQSKDTKQMINALKSVMKNCVEPVRVDDLAPFDLEYLFLKLRSYSVGETADIGVKCDACGDTNKIEVDLSSVKVLENKEHTNIIKLGKDLAFEMRYPDLDMLGAGLSTEDVESGFVVVANSVAKVYHGDDIIEVGPTDTEDLLVLLNSLSSKQFTEIQKFFDTAPRLKHNVDYKCKKCSHNNHQVLEGLASFF